MANEEVIELDGVGAHRLVCAVLDQSIKDMKSSGEKSITIASYEDFVNATMWLGSHKAWDWFDAVGIDQPRALLVLEWDTYAKKIITGNYKLTEKEEKFLAQGIAELERIRPRNTW